MEGMVMTHTGAIGQGQRSPSSKVIVKTDRQMDRRMEVTALPESLMRSVTQGSLSLTYKKFQDFSRTTENTFPGLCLSLAMFKYEDKQHLLYT